MVACHRCMRRQTVHGMRPQGDVDGAKELFCQVAQLQQAQLATAAAQAATAPHAGTSTTGVDGGDDWESNWESSSAPATTTSDAPGASKDDAAVKRQQPSAGSSKGTHSKATTNSAAPASVWDEIEAGAGQKPSAGSSTASRKDTGASARGSSRSRGVATPDQEDDSGGLGHWCHRWCFVSTVLDAYYAEGWLLQGIHSISNIHLTHHCIVTIACSVLVAQAHHAAVGHAWNGSVRCDLVTTHRPVSTHAVRESRIEGAAAINM